MESIDAVITWVDGGRIGHRVSRWLRRRSLRSACADSDMRRRYADHEELRYALRSLRANAPWVRTVFLVTDGSRPAWLKEGPGLRVVTHREIFANAKDLPTFNSRAIELRLHGIEGLSEQFLYFNDDTFLGTPLVQGDFFRDGKIMTLFSEHDLPQGAPAPADGAFACGLKNAGALLDARFGKAGRRQLQHHARPMLRSVFLEFARDFPEAFAHTSSNAFRSRNDVSFAACIHPYYAWHTGRAFESPLTFSALCLGDDEGKNIEGLRWLAGNRRDLFCINDDTTKPCRETWSAMREVLGTMFAEPSPFER